MQHETSFNLNAYRSQIFNLHGPSETLERTKQTRAPIANSPTFPKPAALLAAFAKAFLAAWDHGDDMGQAWPQEVELFGRGMPNSFRWNLPNWLDTCPSERNTVPTLRPHHAKTAARTPANKWIKYSQASSLSFSSILFLRFLFWTLDEERPTWKFERADSIVRLEPVSPWVDLVEWQQWGSMPAHISLPHQVLSHPVQSHFCLAEPHMSSALPGQSKREREFCCSELFRIFSTGWLLPPLKRAQSLTGTEVTTCRKPDFFGPGMPNSLGCTLLVAWKAAFFERNTIRTSLSTP